MNPFPAILSIGTAVPPHDITQQQTAELSAHLSSADPTARRLLQVLYRKTGVQRRGSVLMGPTAEQITGFFAPPGPSGPPSTAGRMAAYHRFAAPLAAEAAIAALKSAGIPAGRITHLVTASCTGFDAPGPDIGLIDLLGLSPAVQRTNVGFMGCHGAINALRVAGAFVAGRGADPSDEPAPLVLVSCCELCSLHFEASARPDAVVANALFADGSAACILAPWRQAAAGAPRVRGVGSFVVPGTRDAMTWRIGDHGFQMTLSPRVPDLIAGCVRAWLTEWLGTLGLSLTQIAGWAVHPGGPRILDAVKTSLSLPPAALDDSLHILANHGNMSSPTVLFILQRLIAAGKLPAVLIAFGPGLTIEAAVVG